MEHISPKCMMVFVEGKTKALWTPPKEKVFAQVQNKPFATAGDGKYREYIPRKGVYVTTATCNIFSLLSRHGIPTHFHSKVDEDTYMIRLLSMIPIEIVVRRKAFGSYLERNPLTTEGQTFQRPIVELFYKNDVMNDPMMLWHPEHQHYQLYHPHEPPEKRGPIGELNDSDPLVPRNEAEAERFEALAVETFLVLEDAFARVGVTLIDFKIECGYDEKRKLYIGDQIDGDSCRLWEDGDKTKAIDKDRYRKITKQDRIPSAEERRAIAKDYQRIAELTEAFIHF